MKEELLHYLWRTRSFNQIGLQTAAGQSLQIVNPGFPHKDAGPDFKQSLIKIDEVTWAGDIEIHVKSSDWKRHRHDDDPKYNSVILHVVYQHDMDIFLPTQETIPTLELANFIPPEILDNYLKLSTSPHQLACTQQLNSIPKIEFTSWLSRLAIERLDRRQQGIFNLLKQCKENWNELTYRILAQSFGFKTNSTAFELLSKSLPYKYLQKHIDSRLQIYALLFGQAGFLDEPIENDAYYLELQREYHYLQYKYQLTPISVTIWNLLRLRPSNFPCIRLAQLSELLFSHPSLIQEIINKKDTFEPMMTLFRYHPDHYWETHLHFGKKSNRNHSADLGTTSIDLLFINTIIPVLYAYSTFQGDETLQSAIMNLYEKFSFEENHITKYYRDLGFPAYNALFSQAILELKEYYCTPRKCLDCRIGCRILSIRN
jgi:hypothetical protein